MKIILYLFLTIFVQRASAQTISDEFNLVKPKNTDSLTKISIWATYYHVHVFKTSGTIPFLDSNGNSLGIYGDTCDFCKAALEGTTIIEDHSGQTIVLNYAKKGDSCVVNCRLCPAYANSQLKVESWGYASWSISSGYGDGVKNYALVPYRTIAVDPKKIPYGSVIYIPKARGVIIKTTTGDTFVHDGYFFAGDTGGAIKDRHIDVFTGLQSQNPFTNVVFSDDSKLVDAYFIEDLKIQFYLRKLHTN